MLFSENRALSPWSFLLINLSCILFTNLLFIVGGPVIQQFPIESISVSLWLSAYIFPTWQFAWMSLFSFQMAQTFYLTRRILMIVARVGRPSHVHADPLPLGITLLAAGLNFGQFSMVLEKMVARAESLPLLHASWCHFSSPSPSTLSCLSSSVSSPGANPAAAGHSNHACHADSSVGVERCYVLHTVRVISIISLL